MAEQLIFKTLPLEVRRKIYPLCSLSQRAHMATVTKSSRDEVADLRHGRGREVSLNDTVSLNVTEELHDFSRPATLLILKYICQETTTLDVILPPAAHSHAPQVAGLRWGMLFSIIGCMPMLRRLHIGGDASFLGGNIAQLLREQPLWQLEEATFCVGDQTSAELLEQCELDALDKLRITADPYKLFWYPSGEELAITHLEIWATAETIRASRQRGWVPGLDVSMHVAISTAMPQLRTLSISHVDHCPLLSSVENPGWHRALTGYHDQRPERVFSILAGPCAASVTRMAITVPLELAVWLGNQCGCEAAEELYEAAAVGDFYAHLAGHAFDGYAFLRAIKIDGGPDVGRFLYTCDEASERQEKPDPVSEYVMFQ